MLARGCHRSLGWPRHRETRLRPAVRAHEQPAVDPWRRVRVTADGRRAAISLAGRRSARRARRSSGGALDQIPRGRARAVVLPGRDRRVVHHHRRVGVGGGELNCLGRDARAVGDCGPDAQGDIPRPQHDVRRDDQDRRPPIRRRRRRARARSPSTPSGDPPIVYEPCAPAAHGCATGGLDETAGDTRPDRERRRRATRIARAHAGPAEPCTIRTDLVPSSTL